MPSRLFARYDNAALRPPSPLAREADWSGPPAGAMGAWVQLKGWCFEGATVDGGRHSAAPVTPLPFSVALLHGGDTAARAQLVEALCQDLDGSVRLAACDEGFARLVFRLRVKLHEMLPGRPPQPADPWDCGYVRDDPAGLRSLSRFTPRRATLIVADALPEAAVRECLRELARSPSSLALPVRLLIVAGDAPLTWLSEASREDTGGVAITEVDFHAGAS